MAAFLLISIHAVYISLTDVYWILVDNTLTDSRILRSKRISLFIFHSHTLRRVTRNRSHEIVVVDAIGFHDRISWPDERLRSRAFTSISRRGAAKSISSFFSSPFPSKITHARINPPRVLRCYVANLFHARSSLPKINPLAITSRAQAKRYKPLCARTWTRVTSHFAGKTDGIVSACRLFKRIASSDIASNIFNALLNNPQTRSIPQTTVRVSLCTAF